MTKSVADKTGVREESVVITVTPASVLITIEIRTSEATVYAIEPMVNTLFDNATIAMDTIGLKNALEVTQVRRVYIEKRTSQEGGMQTWQIIVFAVSGAITLLLILYLFLLCRRRRSAQNATTKSEPKTVGTASDEARDRFARQNSGMPRTQAQAQAASKKKIATPVAAAAAGADAIAASTRAESEPKTVVVEVVPTASDETRDRFARQNSGMPRTQAQTQAAAKKKIAAPVAAAAGTDAIAAATSSESKLKTVTVEAEPTASGQIRDLFARLLLGRRLNLSLVGVFAVPVAAAAAKAGAIAAAGAGAIGSVTKAESEPKTVVAEIASTASDETRDRFARQNSGMPRTQQ